MFYLRCGKPKQSRQKNFPLFTCSSRYYSNKRQEYSMGHLFVISCPPGFTDSTIKLACTNPSRSDLLQLMPVYDKAEGISYRNIFCAACNNVHDVAFYKFRASCSKGSPPSTRPTSHAPPTIPRRLPPTTVPTTTTPREPPMPLPLPWLETLPIMPPTTIPTVPASLPPPLLLPTTRPPFPSTPPPPPPTPVPQDGFHKPVDLLSSSATLYRQTYLSCWTVDANYIRL